MSFVYKAIILLTAGVVFLRISGRKSISQMTISHTVIMISIGSLIVQPIAEKSVLRTVIIAGIFISFTIILEILQIKMNFMEKLITGKSLIVIENGEIQVGNLKKLRMTADQLEMRLREKGISGFNQIKYATIEPNGQLGYELKREYKPLTIGEFEKLISGNINMDNSSNIFDEIKYTNKDNKKLK
ncbi:DUF421 domain-containing protein [Clostridium sp. D2Q-11]|uniref:DUF421 domain-containing protein n=1 Tax=Anaeromonas frigoriresistens TaxID=2683708 RepID=A0A942UZ02_9FIRM|nr:DUF421 domain-containing protein [Anaeromonas frigoriresistens]MBS4538906.1 DUF421 domain-containing protein [Anaeromonas frigoriresistens]